MIDFNFYIAAVAVAFGIYIVFVQIAVIFFRNREKIKLQKETNRLLRKIAGENSLTDKP